MGMASSQARLLSLTSRQLDVELRSQVLQARKLQLANDSRRIYNNYLESLNDSKIQYRYTNGRGESVMRDATLNGLQNGLVGAQGASDLPMFLQSIDGKTLFVTPGVNSHYKLSAVSNGAYASLDEYLKDVMGADFKKVLETGEKIFNIDKAFGVMDVTNIYPYTNENAFDFTTMLSQPTTMDELLDAVDAFCLSYTTNSGGQSIHQYYEMLLRQATRVHETALKDEDTLYVAAGECAIQDATVSEVYSDYIILEGGTRVDNIAYFYAGDKYYAVVGPDGEKAYEVDLNGVVDGPNQEGSVKCFVAEDKKNTIENLLSKNLIIQSVDSFVYYTKDYTSQDYINVLSNLGLKFSGEIYAFNSAQIMEDGVNDGEYHHMSELASTSSADIQTSDFLNSNGAINNFCQNYYSPTQTLLPEAQWTYTTNIITGETTVNKYITGSVMDPNGCSKTDSGIYYTKSDSKWYFSSGAGYNYDFLGVEYDDTDFVAAINPNNINFQDDGLTITGAYSCSYMCSSDKVAENVYNTLLFYKNQNPDWSFDVPKLEQIKLYLNGEDDHDALADFNGSRILFNLNEACYSYMQNWDLDQYGGTSYLPLSELDRSLLPEEMFSSEVNPYIEDLGIKNYVEKETYDKTKYCDYNTYFSNLVAKIITHDSSHGILDPLGDDSEVPIYYTSNYNQVFYGADLGYGTSGPSLKPTHTETFLAGVADENLDYTIPDDYALANNLYMVLAKRSQENDNQADISYADEGLYEQILGRLQGDGSGGTMRQFFTDSEKAQIQSILEYYINAETEGWEIPDEVNTDLDSLYNFFIPATSARSSLNLITSPMPTVSGADSYYHSVHEDDTAINSAIKRADVKEIAQSYFKYYANRGNYTVQEIETIDTSNPEVQKAIAMYNLGQQYKIKVVSDEVAASKDYVTNMIQNAAGVLLTVDTSKVAAAEYTYITSDSSWENPEVERENYLKQVSDKMVSLVEVNDVNISSSVYLDEIANHKRVTEAQATYESEMGKINKKETRLDNQLNQLETERTAIKTEQDSVKNVVKENVDLAFKLFS